MMCWCIEFFDMDFVGIVYFFCFYVFMEFVEYEFLCLIGMSVYIEIDGQQIGWLCFFVSCEFFRFVCFEDWFDIDVFVECKGMKLMIYWVFFCSEGDLVVCGWIVSVCCVIEVGKCLCLMVIFGQIVD